MKKKKTSIYKYIFNIFLISFTILYFSSLTGFYEYQNHLKSELTSEQVKAFEKDVKDKKNIDLNKYLVKENVKYNTNFSKFTSNLSNTISGAVEGGVKKTFKYLSKLFEE